MRRVLGSGRRWFVRRTLVATRLLRTTLASETCCVVRTENDATLARNLFRESFGEDLPTEPVHYLALLGAHGSLWRIVGYAHLSRRSGYGLIGGLCVDSRHRRAGVGRQLIARIIADAERPVYFAQMVHPASIAICVQLGFERTTIDEIFARWSLSLPDTEREQMLREVAALGIF